MQRDTSQHQLDAACDRTAGYTPARFFFAQIPNFFISKLEQSVAYDTLADVTMPRHCPNNETTMQPFTSTVRSRVHSQWRFRLIDMMLSYLVVTCFQCRWLLRGHCEAKPNEQSVCAIMRVLRWRFFLQTGVRRAFSSNQIAVILPILGGQTDASPCTTARKTAGYPHYGCRIALS